MGTRTCSSESRSRPVVGGAALVGVPLGAASRFTSPPIMFVPEFIRAYSGLKQAAGIPVTLMLAVAAVWVWGVGGLIVLAFVLCLWLVMKLWGEAEDLDRQVTGLTIEVANVSTLRDDLAEAQSEREDLERRLSAPSMTLGGFLHALDDQTGRLELVARHRVLRQQGVGEFLVSAVSSDAAGGVIVKAHVDQSPTLALGEECVLIQRATARIVGVGTISPGSADTMIEVSISFDQLDDAAIGDYGSEPDAYLLKLSGLCMEPYRDLSDQTISEALSAIPGLAKSISKNLKRDLKEEGEAV